tara:strand:+ start:2272 stop:2487 length:216 start_codon:yes stop_codon:yes gene_type:complete
MSKKKGAWRIWALALGRKEGRSDKEADKIAIIRTLIMFQLIVTNFFIIAGNVKNLFFDTTPVTVRQVNTKS